MAPLILDGKALARGRESEIRTRASVVAARRGFPPLVLILAFADESGQAPWVRGKERACRAAGIEVHSLVLSGRAGTAAGVSRFERRIAEVQADAVFVQFPFPAELDGDAFAAAIPPGADIDLMHPDRVRAYLAGGPMAPPLTVRAILALLETGETRLDGREVAVVGSGTPFDRVLLEALQRRGAKAELVVPGAAPPAIALAGVSVVVTVAGVPGGVPVEAVPAGATVIDGGYFNPGGRGDVDLSSGAGHLRALAPVPGGVGPMTVSMLTEAVVERAESSTRP